jgi:hypothetical protein
MLEPIKGLEFLEDVHRYRYNDSWMLHSVTGVLSFGMEAVVKAQIEATRDGPYGWAERGKLVHCALEHHFLGAAEINPGRYEQWIQPLLGNWLVTDSTPLAVEYRVCDPRISLGGSFDFLVEHEGQTILGDLKTVSSESAAKKRRAAKAQLGGYLRMLNIHHPRLWIDRCVTLVSGPGIAKVITSEPDDCIAAWDDAWGRFAVHLEVKEPF